MLGSIVSKQIGGITEQPLTDQPFVSKHCIYLTVYMHIFFL